MNDDRDEDRDAPEWLQIAREIHRHRGQSLPVPVPNPLWPYEDLWFSPADPMFSLAVDSSGTRSLFHLDEETAVKLLRLWFRHHRVRYQEFERMDRMLKRIRKAIDGDP
jgi:hypothetical protein